MKEPALFPHLPIRLIAILTSSTAGAVAVIGLASGHSQVATFLWAAAVGAMIDIPTALLTLAYLCPRRPRRPQNRT